MGIFRSGKRIPGKLIDVRVDKWMSWDYLNETAERFKYLLVDIVVPKKAKTSETFEEALDRLELTETDLENRKVEFTRLLYFFIGLAVSIILYGLFVAFRGSLTAALIAFCLSIYCLTQAFRFHFWLFQLKHRKLGCTFKEWLNSSIEETTKKELTVKKDQLTAKRRDNEDNAP